MSDVPRNTVLFGDVVERLRELPDNSIDAIVTDPPYGLEFMGKEWDSFGEKRDARTAGRSGEGTQTGGASIDFGDRKTPYLRTGVGYGGTKPRTWCCDGCGKRDQFRNDHECGAGWTQQPIYDGAPKAMIGFQAWTEAWGVEALRVLKPGGHLLAFGGTRTYHRLVSGLEDAGFEIRDTIAWLYGSGFPKSLDVSKAIDKQRDDRADVRAVCEWLAARRDEAGLDNAALDAAVGLDSGGASASHWTAGPTYKQPRVPSWEQWLALRNLLDFGPEMDAEVWRLNGRKGQPGEAWAEREVVGHFRSSLGGTVAAGERDPEIIADHKNKIVSITAPATDLARTWSGFGTALKPAHEPIVVARKPLTGTVASNVIAWGTGALNVDGCRIPTNWAEERGETWLRSGNQATPFDWQGPKSQRGSIADRVSDLGRWPANVAFDEKAAEGLGEPARYYYCAKASRADREAGLVGLPEVAVPGAVGMKTVTAANWGDPEEKLYERKTKRANDHPTVKPHELMRWLCRLVGGQPGSLILDPFAGSGSTLRAAQAEGFEFLGIERDRHYYRLACLRAGLPDPGEEEEELLAA